MSRNIKQVRPGKRYKSGFINPSSCKKLFESQRNKPIIYRSSYEKDFILWLERSSKVISWGSECVAIKYLNMFDNEYHTYYPDYILTIKEPNMPDPVTVIVEIKPFNQTQKPNPNLPKDSYAWREYIKNISKWKAAIEYCKNNNMQFKILTENTISRLL